MREKPELVALASLQLDKTLYPRWSFDEHRVARLGEAKRAGVRFPAVVADRASRRVVDGFHRCEMTKRVDGPDAMISVEWRDYPDEGALFLDAALLNTSHGLPLSAIDEAHCIEVAKRLGIPDGQLLDVLHLTVVKLDAMKARRFGTGPQGEEVLLKASNRHLAGKTLTPRQVQGNAAASGVSITVHIDQVINALSSGLVDNNSHSLHERLRRLRDLITSYLSESPEERAVG